MFLKRKKKFKLFCMHVAYINNCPNPIDHSIERHFTCKNYHSGVENILFFVNENYRKQTLIKLTSFALSALQIFSLSLTGSASRTDLSQLANGIWEIHAGCPSFLRVSSVAKIGYIPQFKASNARDQDEVLSDLARMQIFHYFD